MPKKSKDKKKNSNSVKVKPRKASLMDIAKLRPSSDVWLKWSQAHRNPIYEDTDDGMQLMAQKIGVYFEINKRWSVNGLATHLGMSYRSLNNYQRKERFSELIAFAKTLVAQSYEEGGVQGFYDKTMCIFLLKAIQNMSDKSDDTNSIINFINIVKNEKNNYGF